MRRFFVLLLLSIMLIGCGSDDNTVALTRRQQTATAEALISPTPTRVRPTDTPFIPPTTTPTRDLGPITITPIPLPVTETPTPEVIEETESPTPQPPTNTPAPTPTPAPQPPRLSNGTLYFQRNGAVWSYTSAGEEREIAPAGAVFRVAPNGKQLALVQDGQLLLLDGASSKTIAEDVFEPPIWAPDSQALAVVHNPEPPRGYARACQPGSKLEIIDLAANANVSAGEGCQPAWDAKSRRLAYVTPQIGDDSQGFNTVALISRTGGNGWTPASAPLLSAIFPDERRIFYAPFWSADGESLYALAYVGYRMLSDVSTLERIDPTNGGSEPIGVAFDVDPASVRALPDGSAVTYTINSPKGTLFTAVLRTDGTPQRFDYFGTPIETQNQPEIGPEFTSAPTWGPQGTVLAMVYCENNAYTCQPGDRASIELHDLTTGLKRTIVNDVDPESRLEWGR